MDKVRMLVTKQLTDNGYRLLDTYKNIVAKPLAVIKNPFNKYLTTYLPFQMD